jgi:hypothetical protein
VDVDRAELGSDPKDADEGRVLFELAFGFSRWKRLRLASSVLSFAADAWLSLSGAFVFLGERRRPLLLSSTPESGRVVEDWVLSVNLMRISKKSQPCSPGAFFVFSHTI